VETAEWYNDRTPLSFMGRSCPLFSGPNECRRPRMPKCPLTMLHQRSSRINDQKVVLHRALARLDKIHSVSSISRAASTFSSFGIPKPTVRGSLASVVEPTFVGIGNFSGASFVKETEP
jgi:hypothetical protein